MTPEQFCYWLQGFAEINGTAPSPEQWRQIKDHLATVFRKVTPKYDPIINPITEPYKPDPLRTDPLRPYTTSPGTLPPTIIC